MPRLLVFLMGLVVLAASVASGEQEFPYKACVMVDGTEIRSGPGQSYYPTDKLQKGDYLEVYRHETGGWCAVKPPEGSITWIEGQYLKLQDQNLAVVTEEDVDAYVGSRLGNDRDVSQVRLHKGETVEILGERENLGTRTIPGNESQIWYKVAPPAGEFRWISSKYLEPINSKDNLGEDSSADGGEKKLADARSDISPAEFQAELDRIDMELSMMVVDDPSAWSFSALRLRTESWLDRAGTAEQRGNARLVLNKIARFEDLKQRYDSMTVMRDQNTASNRFLGGLKRTMEKAAALDNPEKQFDGVGQLQQVAAAKFGAPRYALVDEAGNVKYYVTPAPGVNLQNYIGRQVGITGSRGYMPEQRAQHITARHVTALENKLR